MVASAPVEICVSAQQISFVAPALVVSAGNECHSDDWLEWDPELCRTSGAKHGQSDG
jgi:hypothetical protein